MWGRKYAILHGIQPLSTSQGAAFIVRTMPENPQMSGSPTPEMTEADLERLTEVMEDMRNRLLDLTRRNPLISTQLASARPSYLRVIAAQPSVLLDGLQNDKVYTLESLPALDQDPADEETEIFRFALEFAEYADEEYLAKCEAVTEDDEDREQKLMEIKRELKDKVRKKLGMRSRPQSNDRISLAEHARQHGIAPEYDLAPLDENEQDNHDDGKIQTLLLPKELERVAERIHKNEKSYEEETGVNALQGAFGFLEWSDPESNKVIFSPLITLPIRIERIKTNHGLRFKIRRSGEAEAPERNHSLHEKLKKVGIELPEFDVERDNLEEFFSALEGSLQRTRGIQGRLRRYIAFGRFPSARLAMYQDLANPDPKFLAGLIKTFFLDEPEGDGFGDPAEDYAVDEPDIQKKVPLIVMDADSSQFSTLVDIADGKNLAVEGPPGTGKSQTIVNAIAAAMHAGKKVLFVAEKRAALDVVKARLDKVGLGEFAWLLTASKAEKRKEVIESIRKTREVRTEVVEFGDEIQRREDARDMLKSYIDTVSAEFNGTGMTVCDIMGEYIMHFKSIEELPRDLQEPNPELTALLQDSKAEVSPKIREFDSAQKEAKNAQPHWECLGAAVQPAHIGNALVRCEKIADILRELQKLSTRLKHIQKPDRVNGFYFWWRSLTENLRIRWGQLGVQWRLRTETAQVLKLVGKNTELPEWKSSIAGAARTFRNMANDRRGLIAHSRYQSSLKKISQHGELFALHKTIEENGLGIARLGEIANLVCVNTRRHWILEEHGEELQNTFRGKSLDECREEFARLDNAIIEMHRKDLRRRLAHPDGLPRGNTGRPSEKTEMSLIKHQLELQQAFKSPRYLAKNAGRSLSKLMPCWMMSPLAVAQYVDKRQLQFDLCIIDEASQMLTENAIGALMRAKQVVVVGDEMQLPPTRFFMQGLPEDDEDAEVEQGESILHRANGALHPRRRLQWHYRSRDSRLIKFSNRHFYDDDLIVFPATDEERKDMGVSLRPVTGSSYRAGVNPVEANEMKDAILEFMTRHPDRSLGVVTMNIAQANLLDSEFQLALSGNPAARTYQEKWEQHNESIEKFFIKNIENVQGDERDVIFIGTVYGPEQPGGPVRQRFGPINQRDGNRRLNVLFSRAKKQIVTFSSMNANDITGDSAGARILRKWLEYTETGILDSGDDTGRAPDSPFEEHVIAEIRRLGYDPVPQVGVRGYSIDIGIKHPGWPHGYLLGVECDGATYHSSRSARDRDRLRQEVLEGLGWKLHRIWSTDWFEDPEEEMRKLEEKIQSCLAERQEERRAGKPPDAED